MAQQHHTPFESSDHSLSSEQAPPSDARGSQANHTGSDLSQEPTDPRDWFEWIAQAGVTARWELRLADPLLPKGQLDGSTVKGVIAIAAVLLKATFVVGVVGLVLPFSLIWGLSALIDHRGYLIWLGMAAFNVFAPVLWIVVRPFIPESPAHRFMTEMMIFMGLTALPAVMYVTAAPGALDFRMSDAAEAPNFLHWVWSYGFILVNQILLGLPEMAFGEAHVVRPASLPAAFAIWAVTWLMTIAVVSYVWLRLWHRFSGADEITGTADVLVACVGELAQSNRPPIQVRPLSIEYPLDVAPRVLDQRLASSIQSVIAGATPADAPPRPKPPVPLWVSDPYAKWGYWANSNAFVTSTAVLTVFWLVRLLISLWSWNPWLTSIALAAVIGGVVLMKTRRARAPTDGSH